MPRELSARGADKGRDLKQRVRTRVFRDDVQGLDTSIIIILWIIP
jgi:hypothetical protein